MADLDIDGVVAKQLAKLAKSRAVLDVDVTADRFRASFTGRLKGPFVLTAYADYEWRGKQWRPGLNVSARW